MHDYDWLVIGSGFGGSVSALRLAEQGKRVGVLESGRRFADDELPNSTWDVRRYFFVPRAGLQGHPAAVGVQGRLRSSPARASAAAASATRTRSTARPSRFYDDAQWRRPGGVGAPSCAPHYDTAERMLGVTEVPARRPGRPAPARVRRARSACDRHVRQDARRRLLRRSRQDGRGPVLRRRGPGPHGLHRAAGAAWSAARSAPRTRSSRTTCGSPRSAASQVTPERTVVDIRPLGDGTGKDGYEVVTRADRRVGAQGPPAPHRRRRRRRRRRAGHEQAAAALPAARAGCRGSCDRLGELVRTNSEAVLAVTVPRGLRGPDRSASRSRRAIYPDPRHAHRDRHLRQGRRLR